MTKIKIGKINPSILGIMIMIMFLSVISANCFYVYAADNNSIKEENDETIDDEGGDTFYCPKSTFTSSDDYDSYCREMYRRGYMDKNQNWISEVKDYLNNKTQENADKLNSKAKSIIEQRIQDGEMKPEDNPYITDEKKDEIIRQEQEDSTKQSDGNGTKDNDSLLDGDSESDISDNGYNDESDINVDEEDNNIEEPAQQKKGGLLGKVIMVILICGIAIVSYSIYRRQF